MLSLLPQLFEFEIYGPFVLRIALAVVFIYHGYPKLFGGREGISQWFDSIGIKPALFWTILVGIVEVGGGIFLLLGFMTQLVALLLAIDMMVAIWKVKFKMGFSNGWEFDFILLVVALSLLVIGPGAFSIDLPL
jgi:putative oxidoreductase